MGSSKRIAEEVNSEKIEWMEKEKTKNTINRYGIPRPENRERVGIGTKGEESPACMFTVTVCSFKHSCLNTALKTAKLLTKCWISA